MSTEPKIKKFESVKITFTDLEMSGTTLVKFLEVVKETEPETYTELKKQLIDEFVRYFKDNGIEPYRTNFSEKVEFWANEINKPTD
jgi:hypothetical protein